MLVTGGCRNIKDAIVKTIFLLANRICFWGQSVVDGSPISPYTPREVSRVLGGETETGVPARRAVFPLAVIRSFPEMPALYARRTALTEKKRGGWTPMSDTFGKDFKRPLASSPADVMRSFGLEMAPHTRKRAWRNPGFDDVHIR